MVYVIGVRFVLRLLSDPLEELARRRRCGRELERLRLYRTGLNCSATERARRRVKLESRYGRGRGRHFMWRKREAIYIITEGALMRNILSPRNEQSHSRHSVRRNLESGHRSLRKEAFSRVRGLSILVILRQIGWLPPYRAMT